MEKLNLKKVFLYLFAIVGIVIHIIFWYLYLSGTLSNYSEVRYGDYKIYGRDDGLYCYNTVTKEEQMLTDIRPIHTGLTVCKGGVYFKQHRAYKVYKVNLQTLKTELVLDDSSYFYIVKDYLYYKKVEKRYIYRTNLERGGKQQVTDFRINRFQVIDNVIYMRRNNDNRWFMYNGEEGASKKNQSFKRH